MLLHMNHYLVCMLGEYGGVDGGGVVLGVYAGCVCCMWRVWMLYVSQYSTHSNISTHTNIPTNTNTHTTQMLASGVPWQPTPF